MRRALFNLDSPASRSGTSGKKLRVGNLSRGMTWARLDGLFSQAGTVKSVFIPLDRVARTPLGFALVEMATSEEAAKAIWLLDGRDVDGCRIRVSEV